MAFSHRLPQHDCAAPVEADDVNSVIADIDAHRGNGRLGLLDMAVLLSQPHPSVTRW
jgi:hypothetical protein